MCSVMMTGLFIGDPHAARALARLHLQQRAAKPAEGADREIDVVVGSEPLLDREHQALVGRDHHAAGDRDESCGTRPDKGLAAAAQRSRPRCPR